MATRSSKKSPAKPPTTPILRTEVYRNGREVGALLRRRGREIVTRTAECFNLPLAYYKQIGDIILMFADDEFVGLAAMELYEDKRFYLSTVCTFTEHRGRGYCSWFIPQILAMEAYNSSVVYLEVDRTSVNAVRCYIKAGFVLMGRYDDTYDSYEWRRSLNLLVYSMACNHPGLPEGTGAVSLELGVMADIGKLLMSAYNIANDRWRVVVYLDGHPGDYIMLITKANNNITTSRILVENREDTCAERLGRFLREYSREGEDNALVIGGHDMIYEDGKEAEFWPVSYRADDTIDTITIREIGISIQQHIVGGRVQFLVLDSCCLCVMEVLNTLKNCCEYLVAYQSEGPWNGFLSKNVLNILTTSPNMQTGLVNCLEEYKTAAESEENPSPMTLIKTKNIDELLVLVTKLPQSQRQTYKDVLAYAQGIVKNRREKNALKKVFDSVVVHYAVPNTYTNKEENGVSLLI